MTVTINGTTGITSPEVALDNGTADGGQVVLKSSGYSNWNIDNYSGSLRAYYNATEKMRLDTSGNLGLGVTPSAWASGMKMMDFGTGTAIGNPGSGVTSWFAANGYYDTAWKYKTTNASCLYTMDGQHKWSIAPSGTAGNAISFTQAMTLNASGNLGIGTTSPTQKLEVAGTNSGTLIKNSTTTAENGFFASSNGGGLYFGIDNSIGTYYATGTAYGRAIYSDGTYPIVLFTNATERMRIDSSGNLLVGTTSTGDVNANNMNFYKPDGSVYIGHVSGTATGIVYVGFGYAGNRIGSIAQSGTNSVVYNTSSDYRLKENIAPMTGALAKVGQLKPVTYTWKSDGFAGQGFIAHELQEVVPDCVTGEKDAVDADGNPVYQGIDTSFLVATLTAAIQELKAELDTVKTELATLKGTV